MTVPYSFGTATSAIPLSQLDSNFNTPITLGNTAIQLGNTVTTLNNMTLANVTISSGSTTLTNETVSGNLTLSGGTANGVAYLNGSKVVTTGSALTFDGQTLTNTRDTPILTLNDTAASNVALRLLSTGGVTYVQSGISAGAFSPIAFTANGGGSEQMRLTSTGLGIGLGGGSPSSKLDLVGVMQWQATAGTVLGKLTYSGGEPVVLANTGLGLNFYTNNAFAAKIDSSGNLGLGVTPSAWGSTKAFQLNGYGPALSSNGGGNTWGALSNNAWFDGTNWKYHTTGVSAARYETTGANAGSTHAWYISAGGTAGNAITFTQAMTLDASGNLVVGGTSANAKLDVQGGYVRVNEDGASTHVITLRSNYAGVGPAVNVVTNDPLLFLTNNTERARIDSSGNFYIEVAATTASAANMFLDTTTTPSGQVKRSTSALKYKQDIRDLEDIDISTFRPVRYKSACEGDDQTIDHLGFIADWEDAANHKELVSYGKDGEVEGFQYDRMTAILTKVVQQQQAIIETLTARITALEGK